MFVVQPFDQYNTRDVHPVLFQTIEAAQAFIDRMRAVEAEEKAMPEGISNADWDAWMAQHDEEPFDAYGFRIVALDVEPVVL